MCENNGAGLCCSATNPLPEWVSKRWVTGASFQEQAMLVEKQDQICDECGETMVLVHDYGITGQAFECRLCGYWKEEIDLRETILDRI